MLNYLIDENVNPLYPTQLRRKLPELVVRVIGEFGVPPQGTKDPEILIWCEENSFVLVTNNRTSMPVHLRDHLSQGQHCPGIIIISRKLSIGQNIEQLIFLAEAALEQDFQDQIKNLPFV